jgi:uncharacterized damage-inducible protein DinB
MSGHLSILSLVAYDQWATGGLLSSLAELSNEQFAEEFAGALSSVRQQTVHLISVSDRYRARIMGEPAPDLDAESIRTPADGIAYVAGVKESIEQMVATLTLERLREEIRHDTRRGVFVLTVEETLMHVVNHGTYHRGQIAALLKMHGVEPVDTDIPIWWKRL